MRTSSLFCCRVPELSLGEQPISSLDPRVLESGESSFGTVAVQLLSTQAWHEMWGVVSVNFLVQLETSSVHW